MAVVKEKGEQLTSVNQESKQSTNQAVLGSLPADFNQQ